MHNNIFTKNEKLMVANEYFQYHVKKMLELYVHFLQNLGIANTLSTIKEIILTRP